jgi:hypothetical protein
VDTTAPTVAKTSFASSTGTVGGTYSDAGSGVQSIGIDNTSPSGKSGTANLTSGNWAWSDSKNSTGDHLTITATDSAGNTTVITTTAPAGVANQAINLGITHPSADHYGVVSISLSGVPTGWALNAGINNGDGTWTVQTDDPGALTITTPANYAGAVTLPITMFWTNADGTAGSQVLLDNVEAYAPGSPIFALSSDDHLTGSSGHDLFVFAQPITNDTIHSFDTAADKIDLIGFAGVATFADVQTHMVNDADGNAVLTLDNGETITVLGVDAAALHTSNFVFDQEPVTTNAGTLTISDSAIMPFGGTIQNTGTIALTSTGNDTNLEILAHSVTLQGGGHLTLSDNDHNVIFGGTVDATLINVDNTISGAGQLGAGQMILANAGTIIADGGNALVIDTGAHAITNTGTLEAIGSGGLVINSDIANNGILWANGGNLSIFGNVSGTGSALINGAGIIEFGEAASEDTMFASDAAGTLILDHAAQFSGHVAGFDNNDHLILADFLSGPGTTIAFAANESGNGGTLAVSDGTHTANIELVGVYVADGFHVAATTGGGALVSYG